MDNNSLSDEILLTRENIDFLSDKLWLYFKKQNYAKDIRITTKFMIETVLEKWLEASGENDKFTYEIKKKAGKNTVTVKLPGDQMNTFNASSDDDTYSEIMENLQSSCEVNAKYSYKNHVNTVEIVLPLKSPNPMVLIVATVLLSYLSVYFIKLIPNQYVIDEIEKIFNMLSDTLLSLMNMVAMLFIFVSIISCIGNLGNISTLKKTGKTVIMLIIAGTVGSIIIPAVSMPFMFNVVSKSASDSSNIFNELFQIVLLCIPKNIIDPFREGNALQLLFISFFIGTFLLVIQNSVKETVKIVNQLNLLLEEILMRITEAVPVIIYLSISSLLLRDSVSQLYDLWIYIVLVFAFSLIFFIVASIVECAVSKVSIIEYFKNVLPVILLGSATGASVSCIPLKKKICSKKYHVKESIVNMVIPLQHVLYKTDIVLCQFVTYIVLCSSYGITLSPSKYIVYVIINLILSIATPAGVGTGIAVCPLLLKYFGLPQEVLSIILTIDFAIDITSTGLKAAGGVGNLLLIDNVLKRKQKK